MSQYCPICKAKLWAGPFFTPARLKCPRCSAEFAPTVPWAYFRILLFLLIAFAVLIILFLDKKDLWIFPFLIGVAILFWYLPRIINLQRISGELQPSDGIMDNNQKTTWQDKDENFRDNSTLRKSFYLLLALLLGLLLLISLMAQT